ncbi:M43 family zinc metalloprotease [uncultured Lacinutrix sp.]|uniref:M43 family zinc metalloprotease n=1 Tax=uncultured Lacinutrix sp. TaxID=574032 RepID=UPI0026040D3F|nr:M43 family zinc metalloprotease [uncultured Lacinutrix sp.]
MRDLLLCVVLMFVTISYGQRYCGQDIYQQKIYNEDPSLRPENNPFHKELEDFTKAFELEQSNNEYKRNIEGLTIGTDYIIPVVVHVIHDNGSENVSDEVVERAIEMMNIFFEGKSAYDNNIDSDFLSVRGAFTSKRLKFVLAKFDPNGNPTNGIDRQQDAFYTIRGDNFGMRQVYNWPRANYFNIYVVRQAIENSNTSAFATFPPDVANSINAFSDGVVMSAWNFGEHTEMWQTWYHNLSHEVGHWMNVYHIWANAGGNGDAVYCSQDDSVTDTPNTVGNSLSDLDDSPGVGTVFNCSTKDNYTNMMDYTAPVYAMFTNGQKTRMEAALNSSVSDRDNLWSVDNVLTTLYGCTTGTDTDNDNIPDACDTCPNDINNDSDGDGVCDSLDQCNGYADVNLDGNPSAMDACDTLLPIIDFDTQTILSYDSSEDNGVSVVYDNGSTLHLSTNAWKAIPLNYTITPNTVIEFDFKSTIEGEIHYIGLDNDLSLDPLVGFVLFGTQTNGFPNNTNLDFDNNYTPFFDFYNFKHYSIQIGAYYTGNAPYLIFGADNDVENEVWTSGTTYPGGGSYNEATSFYRNVKIYESDVLSNPSFENIESNISVFPNPVNDLMVVKVNNDIHLSQMIMYDINGRIVKTIPLIKEQSQEVNLEALASGVYFAKIKSNKGVVTKKIIKL